MLSKRLRVLHAPSDVGGQAWGVRLAERKIGLDSRSMVLDSTRFNFDADYKLNLKDYPRLVRLWKRIKFFFWAIKNFDIFHFYFARTLLPLYVDLPILKLFGKKIFFSFQGCDARLSQFPIDYDRISIYHSMICDACSSEKDFWKRLRIRWFRLFSEKLFVMNPDLAYIVPDAVFLPYLQFDLEEWCPVTLPIREEVVIAHAPSDRKIKGTAKVIEAVESLQKKGLPIRFELIENKPFNQVKGILEKADILVDQLYIGWYGALAMEGMALGKPVLSYVRVQDVRRAGIKEDIPIVNVTSRTLEEKLTKLIKDRTLRQKIGRSSRRYVERFHNPTAIARMLESYYRGKR